MAILNSLSSETGYKVNTPVFEGPLDLLLQLIERAELDITSLALAQVTDQYLAFIETMPGLSAEDVSGFLVIAAKLIQIKSEALLPRSPVRMPGEEDPGESLARQLVIYRKFKRVAEDLDTRQRNRMQTFLRLSAPPALEARVDFSGISIQDLLEAALFVNSNPPPPPTPLNNAIMPLRITIRQRIRSIAISLSRGNTLTFQTLVQGLESRLEIIVTFLAVLELIRLHLVRFHQDEVFADIHIEAEDQWRDGEELELEFGE